MKERHTQKGPDKKAPAEKQEPEIQKPGSATAPDPAGELKTLMDRFLRLQADFDNFRKRTARDREALEQRAHEALLTDLLPALDHFELGLKTAVAHNAEKSVVEGFQMVYDQLMEALKKNGVSPIDAEGQVFDPHRHEAISHVPSDEHPAETIIAQTRRGYLLGNKLLRAAQVVVSKGPPEKTGEEKPPSPAPSAPTGPGALPGPSEPSV